MGRLEGNHRFRLTIYLSLSIQHQSENAVRVRHLVVQEEGEALPLAEEVVGVIDLVQTLVVLQHRSEPLSYCKHMVFRTTNQTVV